MRRSASRANDRTYNRRVHSRWTQLSQEVAFSPNFKFSYDVTKKIAPGLEYYGITGISQDSIYSGSSSRKILFHHGDTETRRNWGGLIRVI